MMKRKSDPKQCKSIGGLIAVAVVLAAAGDAARMATGGTASGTHTLDELEFLPPPDPPVRGHVELHPLVFEQHQCRSQYRVNS